MTEPTITRRQLLLTTGTVALVGLASTEPSTSTAASIESATATAGLTGKPPLTFLDGLLSAEELAIGRHELGAHPPSVLQLDLIWEWRRGLHSLIAQGADLIAVTRWDKALLLTELAREAAFQTRQRRIANSLFRTDITR
ncbi:MAG TPA: hypothetical protein VGM84_04710 [Steroidobacteraceae bacterium]|jgi:hypothetical protein